MVFFNYALRKLNAKIVYYGPGLCGKTTNLQWIHDHFDGGSRGKMISLATEGDRTIFFDLLPLDIGTIRGMEVTLQLYTVPGQVHYNSTRQLVLRGADGVVFVADSQRTMKNSNIESLKNLDENLRLQGLELKDFPHILQFNKRDLRDLLTIEEMDADLNEYACPFFEGVAVDGIGVQETLEGIVKLVMRKLRDRYEAAGVGAGRAVSTTTAPAPAGGPQPMARSGGPQPMAPAAPPAPEPKPPSAFPTASSPPADLPTASQPAAASSPGAGFEGPEDGAPEPEVVAFEEEPGPVVDQDNITTATFDGDPDELTADGDAWAEPHAPAADRDQAPVFDEMAPAPVAPRPSVGQRSVDDLLAEATGASTIRVEDGAELEEWRDRAGLNGDAASSLESEDLSLADAQTDTGILFPDDDVEGDQGFGELAEDDQPELLDEDLGPAFALDDPGPAFAPSRSVVDEEPQLSDDESGSDFPRWDDRADSEPGAAVDEFPMPEPEDDLAGGDAAAEDPGEPESGSSTAAEEHDEPFAGLADASRFVDRIRAPSPFAEPSTTGEQFLVAEEPSSELDESPFAADAPGEEFPAASTHAEDDWLLAEEGPEAAHEADSADALDDEEALESPFDRAEDVALEMDREDRAGSPAAATMGQQDAVVFGDDDPFADPFAMADEAPVQGSPVERSQVTVLPAKISAARGVRPEDTKLSLRLQGTGAIAEGGQVRELDIEVPVPGAWVGHQKVTLQLRLTLVPSEEDEDGS